MDEAKLTVVEQTRRALGPIEILVNNASIGSVYDETIFEISTETWRQILSINLDASLFLTRAASHDMRTVGWGRIVMVSSVTGTVVTNGSNVMHVKFGASQIGGAGTTYPGGESDLILDPGVPVLKFTDATKDVVKVGTKVRVQGVKAADGPTEWSSQSKWTARIA